RQEEKQADHRHRPPEVRSFPDPFQGGRSRSGEGNDGGQDGNNQAVKNQEESVEQTHIPSPFRIITRGRYFTRCVASTVFVFSGNLTASTRTFTLSTRSPVIVSTAFFTCS